MFKRILIANRGEIAVRIIRACKEMGIGTVAVYSQADEQALHVQLADEAVCIGPAPARESYLKIANIISAAEIADVDAIHPGYGFLSENAHFAEVCESCNITFIGPTPDNIRAMGDKAQARATMQAAGVPVTPGSEGLIADAEEALTLARRIGYPVLIKAVAGGGGKGMRVARNDVSLAQGFMMARAEAEQAFGNPSVYIEKYIGRARHIEVQVLADTHGHVAALGERDCSIQRRHQKLVEESPAPNLTDKEREYLCDIACRAATHTKYRGAGTIEFLFDEDARRFYFMEMNTRIQVEHPVSEMVTGVDLIREQILVAAGEALSVAPGIVASQGHAMECRINAENPYRDFVPSPGLIRHLHFPGGPGVRVDSHIYQGYEVPPNYDSLLAKIVVHGRTREEALARMSRSLAELVIEGPATTAPLLHAVLGDARFERGEFTTGFMEHFLKEIFLVNA